MSTLIKYKDIKKNFLRLKSRCVVESAQHCAVPSFIATLLYCDTIVMCHRAATLVEIFYIYSITMRRSTCEKNKYWGHLECVPKKCIIF